MKYPGGKGKTFQHVINLMPPHRVYIETHLGGGAVLRHKRPAARSIAIDADARVIQRWTASASTLPEVELVHGRAEDFLSRHAFQGDELVYVDPPYHPDTRRQARVYRHDYERHDHEVLLGILAGLPCRVILSGYAHPLYDALLSGWRTTSFQAKTHTDVRTETLWFNFEPPTVLHDPRHRGDNFRDRQTNRRRFERLQDRVHAMDPTERAAFAQWLHTAYPGALSGAASPAP
ncbi:DNA methylase [Roseateles aquatilis]|uniref:DNA methylase n=1 Tax=Roseateles aquatilis TaxID=431061 RepID=A0A246JGF0_9BURK|nr:DNA methylase [Roseateles aquatilis]OWQ91591.1 DNA methylase [Roseateles aquatilis]